MRNRHFLSNGPALGCLAASIVPHALSRRSFLHPLKNLTQTQMRSDHCELITPHFLRETSRDSPDVFIHLIFSLIPKLTTLMCWLGMNLMPVEFCP